MPNLLETAASASGSPLHADKVAPMLLSTSSTPPSSLSVSLVYRMGRCGGRLQVCHEHSLCGGKLLLRTCCALTLFGWKTDLSWIQLTLALAPCLHLSFMWAVAMITHILHAPSRQIIPSSCGGRQRCLVVFNSIKGVSPL